MICKRLFKLGRMKSSYLCSDAPKREIKYLYADINFNKAKVSVDSCVEVKVLEVDSVMVSETNEVATLQDFDSNVTTL